MFQGIATLQLRFLFYLIDFNRFLIAEYIGKIGYRRETIFSTDFCLFELVVLWSNLM